MDAFDIDFCIRDNTPPFYSKIAHKNIDNAEMITKITSKSKERWGRGHMPQNTHKNERWGQAP